MSYAQAQEDLWALQQFPPGFRGFAVDVGAYDGVTRSNTYMMEQLGWTVLCIEPNPEIAKKLKKSRAWVEQAACDAEPGIAPFKVHVNNMEAYSSLRPSYHPKWHPDPDAKWISIDVKVVTLDEALERWEMPRLDFVSIDTEGTELDVLKGLDLDRWKPHAMAVESWDTGPCPVDEYLAEFGYTKVGRLLVNNLYLRGEQ